MSYVEFRHLSSEIVAPEVIEQKSEKSVKSWFSSYFTSSAKNSETEIVEFIKETSKTEVEFSKIRFFSKMAKFRSKTWFLKTLIKDDESGKSYWMSDASVKSCFNCDKEFSLTRRRHHCRFCGQIFCWKCAPQRSFPISVRSCQKCLDLRRKSQDSPANRRQS